MEARAVSLVHPHDGARRMLLRSGLATAATLTATLGWAQPTARPEKRDVIIALGSRTTLYFLPLTLADQLGYFSAEGLQVELRDHAGSTLVQQAIEKGTADVAAGAFDQVLAQRERGLVCRAFVSLGRATQYVFAVAARLWPEASDARAGVALRGRRVGVSTLGSDTHRFAVQALARLGLAPQEVDFVEVGSSSAAAAALRERRIEALVGMDPVITLLELSHEVRVVWDTRSLRGTRAFYGAPMAAGCLYAPYGYLERYPRTAQALANATVRALKWLQTAGPSDIVKAVPESFMYGDRAAYLMALAKAREAYAPDGMMAEEGVAMALRLQPPPEAPAERSAARLSPANLLFTNDFAASAKRRFGA